MEFDFSKLRKKSKRRGPVVSTLKGGETPGKGCRLLQKEDRRWWFWVSVAKKNGRGQGAEMERLK